MDALSRIFMQVDQIKHDHPHEDPPPWMPVDEQVKSETPKPEQVMPAPEVKPEVKPETPKPEQVVPAPEAKADTPKPTEPKPSTVLSAETANRAELNRLGFKDKKNWNDVRAQKQDNAAALLEQRLQESRKKIDQQEATIEQNMHSATANKKLLDRIAMPNGGVSFTQDEKGMGAAYGYKSFPGAAYDSNTQTLYVAGSDSWESWFHDDPLIPFGKTSDATRYKQAERAYDDLIATGHPVHRVVGHSLGGSVALELSKNKGIEFSRTFGAPVFDLNPFNRGKVERYRHPLDPVSIFDRGATWGGLVADQPHTYGGFRHFDKPVPKPIRGLDLDHKTIALRARSGYSYA